MILAQKLHQGTTAIYVNPRYEVPAWIPMVIMIINISDQYSSWSNVWYHFIITTNTGLLTQPDDTDDMHRTNVPRAD